MLNPRFAGLKFPDMSRPETLQKKYVGKLSKRALQLMKWLLCMEPSERPSAEQTLQHAYFEALDKRFVEAFPNPTQGLLAVPQQHQPPPQQQMPPSVNGQRQFSNNSAADAKLLPAHIAEAKATTPLHAQQKDTSSGYKDNAGYKDTKEDVYAYDIAYQHNSNGNGNFSNHPHAQFFSQHTNNTPSNISNSNVNMAQGKGYLSFDQPQGVNNSVNYSMQQQAPSQPPGKLLHLTSLSLPL